MSGVDLLALAERVEACAVADRELDALVWCTLGIDRRKPVFKKRISSKDGNGRPAFRAFRTSVGDISLTFVPRYTASLDAAMTLVPEGHEWIRKSPRSMTVYRVPDDDKTWALHHDAGGAIPALALTAACLRARHQSAAGEGENG